jgi:hypothetical protein
MTSLRRLDELRVDARHHRQRLDLYRAKVYGPRPTSPSRLKELERRQRPVRIAPPESRATARSGDGADTGTAQVISGAARS